MNIRFLIREILHSKSQAVVFILCVALSLVSIVAINSFRSDVQQSIASDARGLHGGDIIVHSHYDFSPALQQEIAALAKKTGIQVARTWEFYSVARRADGQDSLFSNIKAVEKGYPLYGTVELLSGREFSRVLQPGKVVVAPELLKRLGLALGDKLLLGDSVLEIVDVIGRESLRPVDFFNFGPRILVAAADLAQMDLVQKGSRVQYEALLKVADAGQINTLAAGLQARAVTGQERVATYATASSRVKRFFDNLLFFLSLVSVFTLLLAGIGMQSSLAAFLRRKEKSFAILRSLGATGSFLLRHYLVIVFILSFIGCAVGILSGLLLEKNFSTLFAGLLPDNIVLGGSFFDVLEGIGLGLVVVTFFTFLPLSKIKNVKPAAVFRKESDNGRQNRGTYVLIGCGIILLTGLVVRQLNDLRIGLYFLGGVLALIAVISVLIGILLLLLSRLQIASLPLRQAVRSLLRPGNATRPIVVTLASALSVLLTIYLMEYNLHATYIASYPADAPNLFCLDIQKNQQHDFRGLVGQDVELFPIIRARLTSINGERIHRESEMKKRGDSLAREFNLTYRPKLLSDEVLIKGDSLFGNVREKSGLVPVSLLDTVAEMGDMKMGDVLIFNVQGVPMKAEVSSIRSRTKSMLYPFFYFVFPEENLRAAPQTFFGALKVKKSEIAQLQNTIVNHFPNISTINVGETAAELEKILQKLSTIINFFASFSILAGALILVSSVLATRMARIKEAVYYKVLGADTRFVLLVFFLENFILALLSSGCAILVAQAGSWGLCRFLFDIDFDPSWPVSFAMLVMTVCLVVTLGLLSSVSILGQKPIRFLREQS
ncbi:FtsX-like permease family protein [Desulfopila sp. IMCC35006]|uniref:ABC transporter permease n=1 Tax=Desulfopila sp. IMCC35006 TaxID=2569542 RepID=UPI0010AD7AD7|nr:FtsX-like permease family protein [Desulfopila sp. IMCC35006]TKB24012.1 FtsX-like permease family protein [Desulfopila sp. IMCC35006]